MTKRKKIVFFCINENVDCERWNSKIEHGHKATDLTHSLQFAYILENKAFPAI